jgi:hypothetical protein
LPRLLGDREELRIPHVDGLTMGCGKRLSVLTVEPHTGVNRALEGKHDIADSPGLGVSLHPGRAAFAWPIIEPTSDTIAPWRFRMIEGVTIVGLVRRSQEMQRESVYRAAKT